jgi:hypothetical protein
MHHHKYQAEPEGCEEAMTVVEDFMWKVIASAFIGTALYVGLILVHEEWEEYYLMGRTDPPPAINLNQPWILVALIAGVWALLVALSRWANRTGQSQATQT